MPSLTEATGVGAGCVEALHATPLTEGVLRFVGVERVRGYALSSLRGNRQTGALFTKRGFFVI